MRSTLVGLALLSVWCAVEARGQSQTPFPPFMGERLYVVDVPNVYETLAADIGQVEQDSPQTYYVAVVGTSGDGEWATRDYIDALYLRWQSEAAEKGLPLDPDRSVLIVLSLANRQLALHGGGLLQAQYGLAGQTIDRELVQPHFVPHAKAGNLAEGLKSLVTGIEAWIDNQDAAAAREREAAAERAAEIQRNGETALAETAQLRAAASTELAAKRDAGLLVDAQAAEIEDAGRQLDAAAGLLPTDASAALEQAVRAQGRLRAVVDRLRQLALVQQEAVAQFDRVTLLAREVEEAIEKQRRAELMVSAPQQQLDDLRIKIEEARQSVSSDPPQALATLIELIPRLEAVRDDTAQLPQLARELQEQSVALKALEQTIRAELTDARQAGVDVKVVEDKVAAIVATTQVAEQDYARSLARFESLSTKLNYQRAQIAVLRQQHAALERQHVFRTRTLPATAAAGMLGFAALVLGGLRLRHTRLKNAVQGRLETFKQATVRLLEQLDGLKQRHELLPFSDKDFAEPMTGATLALYNGVEQSHARLRARWLEMMDLRDRAAELLAKESLLGVARCQEADKLLPSSDASQEVEGLYQASVRDLDRLGQAHEEAQRALASVKEGLVRASGRLDAVRATELPPVPYEPHLAAAHEAVEQVQAELTPDPIGAGEKLQQTLAAISRLETWMQNVLARLTEARESYARLDQVERLAAEKRSAGLKLIEDEGNPDPLVAQGRRLQRSALAALHAGDVETAAASLQQAGACTAQAQERIERQAAAAEHCAAALAAAGGQAAEGQKQLAQAQAALGELASSFAQGSYSGVSANVSLVQDLLAESGRLVASAAGAADADVQHYFAAAQSLAEAALKRQQAAALSQAVPARLTELKTLAEQCRQRIATASGDAQKLAAFISAHQTAVRDPARALKGKAAQQQHALGAIVEGRQPDWPAATKLLEAWLVDLEAAGQQAAADARTHQVVQSKLNEVHRQGEEVSRMLQASTADRPRANQRCRAALEALASTRQAAATPRSDWDLLLRQLQAVAEDLRQAQTWAQEDIRLAQQAEAAFRQAQKHVERARGHFSLGASSDLSAAQSQLEQCRAKLAAQAYEQAIQLADSAERSARAVHDAAVAADERRQREQDLARRRLAAAAATTSAAVGSLLNSGPGFSVSGGSSASPPSTPTFHASPSAPAAPSPSTGSSSSTWTSGSSQSTW